MVERVVRHGDGGGCGHGDAETRVVPHRNARVARWVAHGRHTGGTLAQHNRCNLYRHRDLDLVDAGTGGYPARQGWPGGGAVWVGWRGQAASMGHCQLFVVDERTTGGSEVRARTGGREKRSVLGRAAIDGRGDGPGNRDGAGGEGPGTPGSRRPRRRQRPRTRCCRAAPSSPPNMGGLALRERPRAPRSARQRRRSSRAKMTSHEAPAHKFATAVGWRSLTLTSSAITQSAISNHSKIQNRLRCTKGTVSMA